LSHALLKQKAKIKGRGDERRYDRGILLRSAGQETRDRGQAPPGVAPEYQTDSMRSPRYTIVVAHRRTGVVRRFTISLFPALCGMLAVFSIPVLIGLGAAWKAKSDVADVYAAAASLELENANFRTTTATLAFQIESLQSVIGELGAKAALDPSLQSAMDKLPAIVKSQAMGGGTPAAVGPITPALRSPEDTFGLLRELLEGLENRLRSVQTDVDKRNALAAATPSIWPATGWLTSSVGNRQDPITGQPDYHSGLDISADRGSPVYATADGRVIQASYDGGYGNLIVIEHGYGLETRYGHLASYRVRIGDQVKRGDILGLVGSTGRSTGSHLHYEVRVSGRLLNPLQLLLNNRHGD
jgi:murein DD-endopeptidase MepM/ murein hydrolase activator NlpD